jgi:hypothetical protein
MDARVADVKRRGKQSLGPKSQHFANAWKVNEWSEWIHTRAACRILFVDPVRQDPQGRNQDLAGPPSTTAWQAIDRRSPPFINMSM